MRRVLPRIIAALLCLIVATGCSDPESEPNNGNNQSDAGADTSSDTSDDTDATEDSLSVASVQPASGPLDGGTTVVVSGTAFEDVESVTFGASAATDVTRISSFQIEAITPAATQAGPVDITVTLSGGDSATLTGGFEYTDESPELSVGYCVLQFPESTTAEPDSASESIFGRVFVENCSEADQACSQIQAQLGWGPTNGDPSSAPDSFTWEDANYNPDHTSDNNDEFGATITAGSEGTYAYVYRARVGDAWTYCDLDGSDNGFSTDQMGELTVAAPPEQQVDFCTIQFPESTRTAPGVESETIYGRAFVDGCTNADMECDELEAQLGVGDPTKDPSSSPGDYDWVAAAYNPGHTSDDNDEFEANLTVPDAGDYGYVYRTRVGTSDWRYCDVDGSDNGFSTDQMGSLTVDTVTVDWCNLQFPESIDATVGDSTDVFGQAYVSGCTDSGADCEPLIAQLGVADAGSDASSDPGAYDWSEATRNTGFNGQDNDEFQAPLDASTVGSFVYTYRMSGDGGQTWSYCDRDGTDNGFQADQQGTMTVSSP